MSETVALVVMSAVLLLMFGCVWEAFRHQQKDRWWNLLVLAAICAAVAYSATLK